MFKKFEDQKVAVLLGKTLAKIEIEKGEEEDSITFLTTDGEEFVMLHTQSCCESVFIEDVIGDIEDLLHLPLLMAEEVRSEEDMRKEYTGEHDVSHLWTFYKFATNKGSVTLRWYGTSNGCYSEAVDFFQLHQIGA